MLLSVIFQQINAILLPTKSSQSEIVTEEITTAM